MLTTQEALSKLFELVSPLESELISIENANGRVLIQDCKAKISQPSFSSSAMDGYAINSDDLHPDSELIVIGESAAGHPLEKPITTAQAVRIFTGAVVPE